MKSDTLKITALVLGTLLGITSLSANYLWHGELQQYRAAEKYLIEREHTGSECAAYADKMESMPVMSHMLRLVAAQKGDADTQCRLMQLYYARNLDKRYPDIQETDAMQEGWLLAAARQGNPDHQWLLGRFYGTPPDFMN